MRIESIERRAAYFISPHGFGHAARAAAVMEACCTLSPHLRFDIFTRVPEWFFRQSLTRPFNYHELETDLGLVQTTPFAADLSKTIKRLDEMLPFDEALIESLARQVREWRCEFVACDIAPLGILVAERARVPSILVENFTWDWIYEEYAQEDARITRHADYLRTLFERASYHIQTEPVSVRSARATLQAPPVSREPRTSAPLIKEKLGLPMKAPSVLITMGGIAAMPFSFINRLETLREIFFVIPGGSTKMERRANLVLLPHDSGFYHPDLVNASDALVGKIGYSTVAEAFHSKVPFYYVTRPGFRESHVLARFVDERMHGRSMTEEDFTRALWLDHVQEMASHERTTTTLRVNGAHDVANFFVKLLKEVTDGTRSS